MSRLVRRERIPYSISIFNTRYMQCSMAMNLVRAGRARMAWYAVLKSTTRKLT
jgi:hypothetical protein